MKLAGLSHVLICLGYYSGLREEIKQGSLNVCQNLMVVSQQKLNSDTIDLTVQPCNCIFPILVKCDVLLCVSS